MKLFSTAAVSTALTFALLTTTGCPADDSPSLLVFRSLGAGVPAHIEIVQYDGFEDAPIPRSDMTEVKLTNAVEVSCEALGVNADRLCITALKAGKVELSIKARTGTMSVDIAVFDDLRPFLTTSTGSISILAGETAYPRLLLGNFAREEIYATGITYVASGTITLAKGPFADGVAMTGTAKGTGTISVADYPAIAPLQVEVIGLSDVKSVASDEPHICYPSIGIKSVGFELEARAANGNPVAGKIVYKLVATGPELEAKIEADKVSISSAAGGEFDTYVDIAAGPNNEGLKRLPVKVRTQKNLAKCKEGK